MLFIMSPFAFTPADLSALQKGTHAVINQPMLIISGHLHGLDKRKKRNTNAKYFPPFAFKGRVEHDNVGRLGCYSEFSWCAVFGGAELIICSGLGGHLLIQQPELPQAAAAVGEGAVISSLKGLRAL